MDQIIFYLKEYGYYLFVGWIVLYFLVRRREEADRAKMMALFYQAIIFFVLSVTAVYIDQKKLNPHWIWLAVGIVGLIALVFRDRIFPYPKHCANCSAVIPWKERWINTNDHCPACRLKLNPDESQEETTEEPE